MSFVLRSRREIGAQRLFFEGLSVFGGFNLPPGAHLRVKWSLRRVWYELPKP